MTPGIRAIVALLTFFVGWRVAVELMVWPAALAVGVAVGVVAWLVTRPRQRAGNG
jgi:uncharacterized protein YqfA (UPF0365 family)